VKFQKKYPNSDFTDELSYLQASIFLQKQQYKQAYPIFEDLYKKNKQPALAAKIVFGLAQTEFFMGKKAAAAAHFDYYANNFANFSDYAEANYFLAKLNQQKPATAHKYLQVALKKQQTSKYSFLKMKLQLQQDEANAAEATLQHILQTYEDSYRDLALVNFLDYHLVHKNYEKIIGYKAYSLASGSEYYADFNQITGIAFYYLQNYSEALVYLQKATGDKVDYYQALCYLKTDKKQQAEKLLAALRTSQNKEIAANSYFYYAGLQPLQQQSQLWQKFIQKYPDHDFIGAAMYQYGLVLYKLEDYESSASYLQKAIQISEDSDIRRLHKQNYREKAEFLLADSRFYLQEYEKAVAEWQQFRQTYPDSKMMPEVLFKLGKIYFLQNQMQKAQQLFQLLADYQSDKLGQGYYYLAEIAYREADWQKAKQNYEQALLHKADKNAIWLRIAAIHFQKQNYAKALYSLNNVDDQQEYMFDKQMLRGSIYFALKKYDEAWQAFKTARAAAGKQEKDYANEKIAQTLYRMKKFEAAADLYRKLADNSPDFLYKAALAAFSADNFNQAIVLFKDYLKQFPQAEKKQAANLGIADSYYNLGKYSQAIQAYKNLVSSELTDEILQNVLNGLQWACQQSESYDFTEILLQLSKQQPQLAKRLLLRKLNFEFENQNWAAVVQTAEEMEEPGLEAMAKKAASLAKLDKTTAAEEIYEKLAKEKSDYKVLQNWAELKLQLGQTTKAIDLYRRASFRSSDVSLWLQLLQLEAQHASQYFLNDFAKFTEFAGNIALQKARLIRARWEILNKKERKTDLTKLAESKDKQVRAEARYLKGLELYQQQKYQEAIPELLRIRYLFPEVNQARLEAETLACQAYLKLGKVKEARQTFDMIKDDLDGQTREKLTKMLNEGGQK
jgi:tetratricopeptide (TPR) repeat protein